MLLAVTHIPRLLAALLICNEGAILPKSLSQKARVYTICAHLKKHFITPFVQRDKIQIDVGRSQLIVFPKTKKN